LRPTHARLAQYRSRPSGTIGASLLRAAAVSTSLLRAANDRGQPRRIAPPLTIASRLVHTRGLCTHAACADAVCADTRFVHTRVAQTRAPAAIPAVAPCQPMILETLHYLEIKHAQCMRKLHVTQSFHVMATGAPRRTRQTGHTRRQRGGGVVRGAIRRDCGSFAAYIAANDPQSRKRGEKVRGKSRHKGRIDCRSGIHRPNDPRS
jgi:hypothetical protein